MHPRTAGPPARPRAHTQRHVYEMGAHMRLLAHGRNDGACTQAQVYVMAREAGTDVARSGAAVSFATFEGMRTFRPPPPADADLQKPDPVRPPPPNERAARPPALPPAVPAPLRPELTKTLCFIQ